jgi:6-phosphogluconolactonase
MQTLALHGVRVTVFPSKEELFAAGAERFLDVVRKATEAKRDCAVALAGGSTPKALYKLIADRAERDSELQRLAWARVHFFLGDERCVPPEHPDSNYGMARSTLLAHDLVPVANLHRVHTELLPGEAAKEYEQQLRERFRVQEPRFDLILLGMGPDGHTASLFPQTTALQERERLVVANHVAKLDADRITFTLRTLNAAESVLFLVAGEDKREAAKAVLVDRAPLPAGQVHPQGSLDWFLDESAAAFLPR